MLGLGWSEMVLVAAVALVVVGPERLPRLMRDLGRIYGQVRRSADEFRRSMVLEADRQDAEERVRELQERRKRQAEALRAARGDAPAPPAEEADEAAAVGWNDVDPEAPHPVQVPRRAAEEREV